MLRARRFSEDDAERQGAQRVAHFASVALGPAPADLVQEKRPKRQPTLVRRQQPLRATSPSRMDHQLAQAFPALRFDSRKSLATCSYSSCPERDSNPQGLLHQILSLARLPIPPSGRASLSTIAAQSILDIYLAEDCFTVLFL
jgi:hypothetical protein